MLTQFILQYSNGEYNTYHGMDADQRLAFPYTRKAALSQLEDYSHYDPDCRLVPIQFASYAESGDQIDRSFRAVGVSLDPLALLCALDEHDKANGDQSRRAAIRSEGAKGIYSYPYRNPGHRKEWISRKLENARAMLEQCPADE